MPVKKSMGFNMSGVISDEMESSLETFMVSIKKKKVTVRTSDFDKLTDVEKKATYLSPDWDNFVMSQFADDELVDGHPKVHGLRRVAELLLGDIVSSSPIDVHPVAPRDETHRSTVGYSITFNWFDNSERTYADVADVHSGNQDPDFLIYSVATAATRAEGRALRKALKLKKCAFEEIGPTKDEVKSKPQKVSDKPDPISSSQIRFLDKRCKDLDVDVLKFINKGQEQFDVIEDMTKVQAKELIDFLAQVTAEKETLDKSVKGYNPSWRD